ncbi:MAG: heavy metal-responsive transcriptional regulator [Acidobacteria bacterium]|nr:heavy metal-responsive transcriptional regulator [Acidobacteriota bacterium]
MMRLKIGELAAAGVSPHTIRYYEKLNLLPRASRTYAGYRQYTEEDVKRLRFIKQSQIIGFSLDEIKQVLLGGGAGLEDCQRIRDLLNSKLGQIDNWLAGMRAFWAAVATYLGECEDTLGGKGGDCCPVLFELTQATSVVEEPELISVLKSNKSAGKTCQEKAVADEVRSGRTGRQGSAAGNCCEPLLYGAGLVRSRLAESARRGSHC